jgi:SAM-dependent methyltransferase
VLDEDHNRTCQITFDQLESAGEKVLDVGCGDGAVTQQLVEAGCEVVGVDASPQLLEAARARGWVAPGLMDAGQFGIRKRSVRILSIMGTLYSGSMRTVTNELGVVATCSLQTM